MLLVGSDNQQFRYSFKFMFLVMNNVTEYEGLLANLGLARKIRAEKVTVYVDLQLVTEQVLREYKVKDPHLKKYHELIGKIWKDFIDIQLIQILREKNYRVDKLSRLDTFDLAKIIEILVEYIDLPITMAKTEVLTIDPPDWRSLFVSYLENPNASSNYE